MKTLLWTVTGLLALLWTGTIWLTQRVADWLLGSIDARSLGDAGGAVAQLPLPPLPEWLAPWLDLAWLEAARDWSATLLGWLATVFPSGDALMAWIGPLLWVVWGLCLACLLAVAGVLHLVAGKAPALKQAVAGARA